MKDHHRITPDRSKKLKTNTTDLAPVAQEFFAAYDAHNVEGMIALCADGARGRYACAPQKVGTHMKGCGFRERR
jgi:hypothetical protein